jgi:hypothetical protein
VITAIPQNTRYREMGLTLWYLTNCLSGKKSVDGGAVAAVAAVSAVAAAVAVAIAAVVDVVDAVAVVDAAVEVVIATGVVVAAGGGIVTTGVFVPLEKVTIMQASAAYGFSLYDAFSFDVSSQVQPGSASTSHSCII